MENETFTITMSLLLDAGLSDFEVAWNINDATEKIDEFSRKFEFLEKPLSTWVTGYCYFDYGCHEKDLPIESLTKGNRKVYIGVSRTYLQKTT